MHARLTRFSISKDRIPDFIQAFERRGDDTPRDAQPSDSFLLVDSRAGTAVSISLWESEEAMRRGGELGAESRQRAVDAAAGSVSSTETFEVAMHLREYQPTPG